MEIQTMYTARAAHKGVLPVAVLAFAAGASAQLIYPYAGTGAAGSAGIGGDPLSLQLNTPMGIASNSLGNSFIADYGNNRVVLVSYSAANLYAGNGQASSSGDGGPAAQASLNGPFGVVMDENQNLYISEYSGGRIRKVDFSTQTITTVAGNGSGVSGGDGGPATSAGLANPAGIAYASGILYVVEYGRSVRQINLSTGIITTLVSPSSGQLSIPVWVTVEKFLNGSQRVLVTDLGLHKILSVDPNTGAVALLAGNGDAIFEGDGMLAANTGMGGGRISIFDDQNGGLYAADANLSRIRRIDRDTGVIETVAGNGFNQPLTPNTGTLATSTALQSPQFAMASSSGGYALLSDSNNRVWLLYLPPSSNSYTATIASANPVSPHAGQSMSLTATVAPIVSTATPTGSVTFEDVNFNVIGTATLSGGSATLSTTAPPTAGSYPIYAVYNGDTSFYTSTSPALMVAVQPKNPSTTALSSSPNPTTYGQTVNLTVTITPSSATGTVQFLDGTTPLFAVTFSGGSATVGTVLAAGIHALTAVYSGDGSTASSTSPVVSQTVSKATPSLTLLSPDNPSIAGNPVTFIANITVLATGTVQFLDGSTPLGTVTLVNGQAVISTSSLSAGTHSITANYSGDSNFIPASASLTQAVKIATTITLGPLTNPVQPGQNVKLTATVSPSAATGTVTFYADTNALGTGRIINGSASLTTSFPLAGMYTISASYSGDATYATSTSFSGGLQVAGPVDPGTTVAIPVTFSQVNLNWASSSTNKVTYNVYSSTTSGFTPSASNRVGNGITGTSYSVTGLQPATTYYFLVTAQNSSGESGPANQVSATTFQTNVSCHVTYTVTSQTNNSFSAAITIQNTGATSLNGWALGWTWPGNQQITSYSNAGTFWGVGAQNGQSVTLTNLSTNATVAPGATLNGITISASYNGKNVSPSIFTVDAAQCQ
jgi:hypothetical protein